MVIDNESSIVLAEAQRTLLVDLIQIQQREGAVNALRFRADNDEQLAEIESLEGEGWIRRNEHDYVISLIGLSEIKAVSGEAESILLLCGNLFDRLKLLYKQEPGRKLFLTDFAEKVDQPLGEIKRALPYLKQTSIFGGWGLDENATDAFVVLGEDLIRKGSFAGIIDEQRGWALQRRSEATIMTRPLPAVERQSNSIGLFRTPLEIYTRVKQIGQGGTGVVVEVCDQGGRTFALKYLRPGHSNAQRMVRFKNEIRFGQRSVHPNIVPVVDVGKGILDDVESLFFVMPIYPLTLRQALGQGITSQVGMSIFEKLLNGIRAAHSAGVFHRDLKPENVLLSADFSEVRIGDFGIANFSEEAIYTDAETRAADRFGNFVYAAPEQRTRGAAQDRRADLFSLGLILNELFTGEVPHGAGYRRISSVDEDYGYLDDVVEALIQQDPDNRPSTAEAVRALLAKGKRASETKSQTTESSTVFFSHRFARSFPGIRGYVVFDSPSECIKRLRRLLQPPLRLGNANPIWWWRSGDMPIETFSVLNETTVLLDCQELIIDSVAAVNAGAYYQQLVYVQTKASEPSGLYKNMDIDLSLKEFGFAREEFGIYEGRFISRAEYDDGAAVMDGELVDFKAAPELRIRYLTPYNVLLAPHDSPINYGAFDERRDTVMNAILRGEATLEDLVNEVRNLPKRSVR
jgi:serine/threonine protein kinase